MAVKPENIPYNHGHKADDFRRAIAEAEREGMDRSDMVLRLTLRDDADLKRDRNVKVEEISFKDGVMRFLGVRVAPGGVPVSRLDTSGVEPVVEVIPVKAPPKPRKRTAAAKIQPEDQPAE